jgi:hypothetical protein
MRRRWIIAGILLACLAVAYTGYWFWLAQTFERNLAFWIDQQRMLGYRISYAAAQPHGFPFPVGIGLTGVAIEPPPGGTPWRLDTESMELSIAPWAPLSLRIDNAGREPEYRLGWLAGSRNHEVVINGLRVVLRFSDDGAPPALRFPVQSVRFRQGDRDIAGVILFSGDVAVFNVSSHAESSVTFNLSASGIDFLHMASDKTVETYDWQLSGRIMGRVPPEPLTRALAAWSDDGGYLELTQFKANWEAVTDVNVNGSLALDQRLQPVGSMTARLRNYADLIDWLVSIGVMSPGQATTTKLALAAMSHPVADGSNALEARVPITIQNGYLSVGPAKIAQIPPILWQ